jgi:hypothetical protein
MPRLWDERVGFSAISAPTTPSDFQGVRPSATCAAIASSRPTPKRSPAASWSSPSSRGSGTSTPRRRRSGSPTSGPASGVERGLRAGRLQERHPGARGAHRGGGPDFSLLDARYSVIRYVATPTRSANSGGDVVDPRSGEVIRAHTNMYHGLDERLRWWLVSQVAAANPKFRTHRLSEEDMGEALRYVVSHETAHSVGLPHNQRANFVFPIDSIRDPTSSSAWATPAPRWAGPATTTPPSPATTSPPNGASVWDKFAVFWGYRPIPEAGPRTRRAAHSEPLDHRAFARALVPLRLRAVRHGRGVGPVPHDRRHIRRPRRSRLPTA